MRIQHSLFFEYTCRSIKYFLLFTIGLVLVCLVAILFGQAGAAMALFNGIWPLWIRFVLFAPIALGCAVIFESMR